MGSFSNLVTRNPRRMFNMCRSSRNPVILSVSRQNYDAAKWETGDKTDIHKTNRNPSFHKKPHGFRMLNDPRPVTKGREDMIQNSLPSLENMRMLQTVSSCHKREITNFRNHLYCKRSPGICLSGLHDCRKHLSTSGHKAEKGIDVVLDMMAPKTATATHTEIVPGKGQPPDPPTDCCTAGCVDCVWILYVQKLRDYFPGEKGLLKAKEAVETINDPQLKLFLKIELEL